MLVACGVTTFLRLGVWLEMGDGVQSMLDVLQKQLVINICTEGSSNKTNQNSKHKQLISANRMKLLAYQRQSKKNTARYVVSDTFIRHKWLYDKVSELRWNNCRLLIIAIFWFDIQIVLNQCGIARNQ